MNPTLKTILIIAVIVVVLYFIYENFFKEGYAAIDQGSGGGGGGGFISTVSQIISTGSRAPITAVPQSGNIGGGPSAVGLSTLNRPIPKTRIPSVSQTGIGGGSGAVGLGTRR